MDTMVKHPPSFFQLQVGLITIYLKPEVKDTK